MNTKRIFAFSTIGIFFISMMTKVLGTDYSPQIANAAQSLTSTIGNLFGMVASPITGNTGMFSKFLMFILLGMIIYSIIATMFKGSHWFLRSTITISITLLAMIGISNTFLKIITAQYGAMGSAILTVIPFIIILFFSVEIDNLVIAKLTWAFYLMYYLSMYVYLSLVKGGFSAAENIPYGIAFLTGIIIFCFIKEIRNIFTEGELDGLVETAMKKVDERGAAEKVKDANLETETGIKIGK